MRCPFCGGTFTLQGPYCPLCGRRIIGRDDRQPRPSQPPQSPPVHSHEDDDILVVELEPEPPPPPGPVVPPAAQPRPSPAPAQPSVAEQPVSQEFLGRVCPYCRFPLKQGERMVVCPACKVGHHSDCWRENGGCTTYGCRYAPQAHPAGQTPAPAATPAPTGPSAAPGPATYGLPTPAAAAAAARLEADANSALVVSILGLFCFGILSLIGIALGIGVLARMRALGLNVPGARSKAIAAIVIGVAIILITLVWVLLASRLAERATFPSGSQF